MTRYRERLEAGEFAAPTETDEGASAPSVPAFNGPDLDAMTKDDLLAHAQSLGLSPANAAMTKGEIRAAIAAHYAEE